MEIEIKDLIDDDSPFIGKKLWISDFRREDIDKKPNRHIRPQLALLRHNDELPARKSIYYSNTHFVGLNKKGEAAKSKIMSIFDNTGYRWRTGTPVKIFDSEQECRASYVAQAKEIIVELDERILSAAKHWQAEKNEVNSEIEQNK